MTMQGTSQCATEATREISDPVQLVAEPLVSVYMLAFKHEKYIAQAIEGVLSQNTQFPFELIVGEDHSPDQTLATVLQYQRSHPETIRVLTADRNLGAYENARRCIRATRGRFIAVCEGDDYWHHPGKLQLQIQTMLDDPSISLCYTDFDQKLGRFRLKSVYALRQSPLLADGENAYLSWLREWLPSTATTTYRADILKAFLDSPFDRRDWPFGDYTKALFAATHGKVRFLPTSTATWTKVPGSSTNSGHRARLRMGQALAECREAYMSAYPVDDDIRREAQATGHWRTMTDAFVVREEGLYREHWEWLRGNGFRPSRLAHAFRLLQLRIGVPTGVLFFAKKLAALRKLSLLARIARQQISIGQRSK